MRRISVKEVLFDDSSTRKKHEVMNKLEVIFDDARNTTDEFWVKRLENFLQFGHKYRITFEDLGKMPPPRTR